MFSCKFCGKEYSSRYAIGGHSVLCPKNPSPRVYSLEKCKCRVCGKEFSKSNTRAIHERFCDGSGKKKNSRNRRDNCRFCGKTLEELGSKAKTLCGHTPTCLSNPKAIETRRKMSVATIRNAATSRPEVRARISATANRKVAEGTWHNSFSKSRTHEYNGVRFYGKWELNYAKWLDSQGVEWRRPKESFHYDWNDKPHRYTPDFFLIEEQTYVEIKGYETDRDRAKWSQFPLKLKVLKGKELLSMGLIESYKETN